MATTVLKLAEPTAAKPGAAMTAIAIATAAMTAKLLMRVIWDSPLGSDLEPVAEVQADEVCVGAVRPVEVVVCRAVPHRAARLEVKGELRGVDDPVTMMPADSERGAFAVGVGEQRADVFGRLRRAVVDQAEADVPGRIDGAVRAEAVRIAVVPVLYARKAGCRRGQEVDFQLLEAAPGRMDDVELEIPVRDGRRGNTEVRDRREV